MTGWNHMTSSGQWALNGSDKLPGKGSMSHPFLSSPLTRSMEAVCGNCRASSSSPNHTDLCTGDTTSVVLNSSDLLIRTVLLIPL